jgi:nucleolar protein TMA23
VDGSLARGLKSPTSGLLSDLIRIRALEVFQIQNFSNVVWSVDNLAPRGRFTICALVSTCESTFQQMDTTAYLKRQGWKGDGHSLDHGGRGIRKPLLVSKKIDVLGVGLNKHAAVSDQWWMRAFDEGLKSLGSGNDTALANVQKHGIHLGSLYSRFVKGEGVAGTIGQNPQTGGQLSNTPLPSAALEGNIVVKRELSLEAQRQESRSNIAHLQYKLKKAKEKHEKANRKSESSMKGNNAEKRVQRSKKLKMAAQKLDKANKRLQKAQRKHDKLMDSNTSAG